MGLAAPFVRKFGVNTPAAAQAAGATTIAFRVPFAGSITKVCFFPNAPITGANTDTRKVAVVNKGLTGSGTTEVAALQFTSGVNGVAFDEKEITLSATEANRVVAEGDCLVIASTAVGAGLADPGGHFEIELSRA